MVYVALCAAVPVGLKERDERVECEVDPEGVGWADLESVGESATTDEVSVLMGVCVCVSLARAVTENVLESVTTWGSVALADVDVDTELIEVAEQPTTCEDMLIAHG